jgi:TolA-binding protein
MRREVAIALTMILVAAASSANADEYTLYKGQKASSGTLPAPGDGVLTKTITIREGDTLSGLSRQYSGRGSFFPQILLFNRIENPDLIYAGKTLRVPITRHEGSAAKAADAGKKPPAHKATSAKAKRRTSYGRSTPDSTGKQLFDRGVEAFVNGDYREAIGIFDRYLAAHPKSIYSPEAALYRADSYMKLSGR